MEEGDAEIEKTEPDLVEAEFRKLFVRRRIIQALSATGIGGVLGYAFYPWIAGDQRDELATSTKHFLRRMREGYRVRRDEDETLEVRRALPARVLPVVLDAEGKDYQAYLTTLRLRHIQPIELLRAHFKARGSVTNSLPPRELWKKIGPTLLVADELREQLNVPLLTISSAYRSPAYNASCAGAASHSYHMENMALDLVYDCPPAKVAKAAEALRARKLFKGGVGRYDSFTHIDTRGKNADWG
jgi:hypothetical protein